MFSLYVNAVVVLVYMAANLYGFLTPQFVYENY